MDYLSYSSDDCWRFARKTRKKLKWTNLDRRRRHYLPITHQMVVCKAGKVELDPEVES